MTRARDPVHPSEITRLGEAGLLGITMPEADGGGMIAEGAPPVARWHRKFARRLAEGRPLEAGENDESTACFDIEDYREGVAAFLAKRKPEFRGR